MVERLFLAVTWGCLWFVIVVFPDHTHLLFLKYIHLAFLCVGKVLNSMSMLSNYVRVVIKGNTKIQLLSGTYIVQENRARSNQ